MSRLILSLILLITFGFGESVKAQEPAPYLYYYSDKENAFVVERADGSNRHLFAKDVTPRQKDPLRVDGPGWSPDGKRFAWRSVYYADGRVHLEGHLIGTGSQEPETLFRYIENLYSMYWSPNSQYLLVYLNPVTCGGTEAFCGMDTYWLVDVTLPTLRLRSIFDIRQQREPIGVEWAADKGEVILYIWEDAWGQGPDIGYLKITMHDDGRVEKQPISHDEWRAKAPPIDSSSASDDKLFTAPSGKYRILLNEARPSKNKLQNMADNTTIKIPISQFGSTHPMTVVNAIWSGNEEWVMAGYVDYNGLYGVGVFKRDGTGYREITTCGPSLSCAGWLPENVDVDQIGAAG